MQAQEAPLEITDLHSEVVGIVGHLNADVGRLQQIEVRIHRLLKTTNSPRRACFGALFLIAYGLGDRQKTEACIEEVCAEQPLEAGILQNAVAVLVNFGSHSQALELINLMDANFPDSKSSLESAMINTQIALLPSLSVAFLERLDKLTVNEAPVFGPRHRMNLMTSLHLAKAHGMTDDDLSARLDAAVRAIRDGGKEVRRENMIFLHDGSFISQLYIDADAAACATMNFEIADALVEQFDDPGAEVFSIACRPLADFDGSVCMAVE